MHVLTLLHGAAATAWMGLIAAETVLELSGRDAASRRWIAEVHARIDTFLEGPLVLIVLVTGGLLLVQAWPAPPLLLVKVAAGLIAVVANLLCIPLVWRRAQLREDTEILRLFRHIQLTGFAIPFALIALVLGWGVFAG